MYQDQELQEQPYQPVQSKHCFSFLDKLNIPTLRDYSYKQRCIVESTYKAKHSEASVDDLLLLELS